MESHLKIEKVDWLQAVKALIEAKANVNARSIGFIFLVFFLDVRSGEKRDAGVRARAHAPACTRAPTTAPTL